MELPPDEKTLRTVPFATHAARGVIRDPRMRRRMMLVLVLIAGLMAVAGTTVLRDFLNPREHFGWFAIYWLSCAWLTFTSVLLASFDLLMARAERRAADRVLRQEIAETALESQGDRDG